ncbi:MAG: hypothetical protein JWO91_2819 [Acidobacteriaceae bacterium]|nr:hypothetical protein [Acidobacteriaceae bacterium]
MLGLFLEINAGVRARVDERGVATARTHGRMGRILHSLKAQSATSRATYPQLHGDHPIRHHRGDGLFIPDAIPRFIRR